MGLVLVIKRWVKPYLCPQDLCNLTEKTQLEQNKPGVKTELSLTSMETNRMIFVLVELEVGECGLRMWHLV